MRKLSQTDVPGLLTDGRGTVVNADLSDYMAIRRLRRSQAEGAEMARRVAALEGEVRHLRDQLARLIGALEG